MKTIYRIAKTELSTMFYSPVAWLVLVIFTVQSNKILFDTLDRFEKAQQMGLELSNLTDTIFAGFKGVFTELQSYLYLYIPLLTMGLISREVNSGSIKLLLSSPIKIKEIILGKYLAITTFCFLFIIILIIQITAASYSIDQLDVTFVCGGLLGLYLLVCTYAAIGLFMSCLTSYQVVAAISTLVVLASLNYIGKLWQGIDFIRDITYFLSIAGRADEMIGGLLVSKDILYFILVSSLFLGFSIFKLQTGRVTDSRLKVTLNYAGLTLGILAIGYISSRPLFTGYADMTSNHRRTLTINSQKIVAKITEPLKITTYVNLLDTNYFLATPEAQNSDIQAFEKYLRFLPDLQMEYIYYYNTTDNTQLYQRNPGLSDKEIAEKVIETQGLSVKRLYTPEEIKKKVDLQAEGNRLVRVLSYKGKQVFLRMYDDLVRYPQEKEISAALKRLVDKPVTITFASGNRERDVTRNGDENYKIGFNEKTFRYALINQGFSIDTINLALNKIPKSTDILVIADPKKAYNQEALNHVYEYIASGRNLMVLSEPEDSQNVAKIVTPLGVTLTSDRLVQQSTENRPDFILTKNTTPNETGLSKISTISKPIPFLSTSGVRIENSTYKPSVLLSTNSQPVWKTSENLSIISDSILNSSTYTNVPLLVSLSKNTQGKHQKMIISGDADFMDNAELNRNNTGTFQFVTHVFEWLANGAYPIDTTRPEPKDNKLLVNAREIQVLKIFFVWVFPALIVAFGSLLLIYRNRR